MGYNYSQISKEYGSALIELFDQVLTLHSDGVIDFNQHENLAKALNKANDVTNKGFADFK